jgi:hypothetical protein
MNPTIFGSEALGNGYDFGQFEPFGMIDFSEI